MAREAAADGGGCRLLYNSAADLRWVAAGCDGVGDVTASPLNLRSPTNETVAADEEAMRSDVRGHNTQCVVCCFC